MSGPCVKQTVTCTIVATNGMRFVGTNACDAPQERCPREGMPTGVGYELCKSVCKQRYHAEVAAARLAGDAAVGATAYLEGHTYVCDDCAQVLADYGVAHTVIGAPPTP